MCLKCYLCKYLIALPRPRLSITNYEKKYFLLTIVMLNI